MPDQPRTGDLFTYLDRDARIVWIPVAYSDDVFDEEKAAGTDGRENSDPTAPVHLDFHV
jgi:hypothetical protein